MVRIPFRGKHNAKIGIVAPAGFAIASFHGSLNEVVEIAFQSRKNHFCLRVAETGVKLNNLRALL